MSNIIKPSTKMLPMADIAQELELSYEFSKTTKNASDTNKVSGTNADLIAVAATDPLTGNLISDRETVKNALELNGTAASEYITKEYATKLELMADNVSKIYADEIRSLRDELYQIRGQLVKQGIVNEFTLYEGFQDFFSNNDVKYYNKSMGILMDMMGPGINEIYPEDPAEFNVNDWFVIHKDSDALNGFKESDTLVRVTAKNDAIGAITFTPALADLAKSNVRLMKVMGQYSSGAFSFSKILKDVTTEKEKYTMLNDDSNLVPLKIDSASSGYASAFKVPNNVAGALTKFTIQAKASGSPGALQCYIIKESAISTFKNIAAAEAAGMLVGKSKPVSSSNALFWTTIDFDFQDSLDGSYPVLSGERYCFIVEALSANQNGDHWEIMFSSKGSSGTVPGDLQSNNVSYVYKSIADSDPDPTKFALLMINSIGSYDLYFVLTTKEIAPEYETSYKSGLYTAKFTLPTPINISRTRLTARINREGNYIVVSSPGAYSNGDVFSIGLDPAISTYNLTYGTGIDTVDDVAIGASIRNILDSNNTQIKLEKGIYVDDNNPVPVYRIGYNVFLRASLVEWDEASNSFKTTNKQYKEMPLTAILPDGNKQIKNSSDRIIFENEFDRLEDGTPLYVNAFEVQIVWNSNFPVAAMDIYKELIGKIYDLTLSFDKSL